MLYLKTLALAATATIALASPALAKTITYTLSGTFSGVNGGAFTNVDAVFTGVGDTASAAMPMGPEITVVALNSFSAVANGATYNFTSPISFFVYRSMNYAGFVSSALDRGFIRFNATAPTPLTTYDGVSGFAATPATFFTDGFTGTFNTDRGDVLITGATNLSLSATVPEPASWALMIVGFGLTGSALRRRKTATTVSFG